MTAVQPPQDAGSTYTFQSKPTAIASRPRYRITHDDDYVMYGNIMYDRRVVRGNTYSQSTLPLNQQPDPVEIQRRQEARRRAAAKARAREQLKRRTPPPVEGRQHINLQTELYLEALTDQVEEADVAAQTDAFLDRPPTPLFVPAKSGMDVETQIYEGDLFDFDIEVKPILEVLVGKTVEQALIEVMEEEELANLRQQQRQFQELRNAELVEAQRLKEKDRRLTEEKQRRIRQQKEALIKEKETADKIAARAFARSYLADLVPSVFSTLRVGGYFFDPVERDVEECFLPGILDQVVEIQENRLVSRLITDMIIREVAEKLVVAKSASLGSFQEEIDQNEEKENDSVEVSTTEPETTELKPEINKTLHEIQEEEEEEEKEEAGDFETKTDSEKVFGNDELVKTENYLPTDSIDVPLPKLEEE